MAARQGLTPLGAFNYASLSALLVYWRVPASVVRPLLKGTGLQPAIFGGQALVNLNFERYGGVGSNYFTPVVETEFNVVSYAARYARQVPPLTLAQYLNGDDSTKLYGNFRAHVACTDPTAVKFGSQKYGEIKFVCTYDYAVPDVNDPTVLGWSLRCFDRRPAPKSGLPYIFDLKASFQSSPGQIVNISPLPAYANLRKGKKTLMVVSSRNVYGPFHMWVPSPPATGFPASTVALTIGDSRHPMRNQMAKVFAKNPPAVAIQLFESQPAATSGHTILTEPVR